MDKEQLRVRLFEKTGMRVDVDDPIFTVVALNEVVLEEMVARIEATTINVDSSVKPVIDELLTVLGALAEAGKKEKARLVDEIRDVGTREKFDLKNTAVDLLKVVGEKIDKSTTRAISETSLEPVRNALGNLNEATGNVHSATEEMKIAVGKASTVLAGAASNAAAQVAREGQRIRLSWWQIGGGLFAAMLVSATLPLLAGKWLGVIVTKAELHEVVSNQRVIAAKLEEIKPSRK